MAIITRFCIVTDEVSHNTLRSFEVSLDDRKPQRIAVITSLVSREV